jgi:hypothetical protein
MEIHHAFSLDSFPISFPSIQSYSVPKCSSNNLQSRRLNAVERECLKNLFSRELTRKMGRNPGSHWRKEDAHGD